MPLGSARRAHRSYHSRILQQCSAVQCSAGEPTCSLSCSSTATADVLPRSLGRGAKPTLCVRCGIQTHDMVSAEYDADESWACDCAAHATAHCRLRLQRRAHSMGAPPRPMPRAVCRALSAARSLAALVCCISSAVCCRLHAASALYPVRHPRHPDAQLHPTVRKPTARYPMRHCKTVAAHVLGELALELGDPRVLAFQERDQPLQHLSDASAVPSTVPSGRSHAGPNLAVNAHTLTCTDLRTQCPTLPVVALLNVVRCAVVNGVRPVSYAPCCTRVTQAHARIMPSAVAEGSSDALCCNVFYYVATDCTTVRTYFSALHKGRTGTSARTMPSAIAKGSSACKAKLSSAGGPWRAETHARKQANPQACAHAHKRT
jgi:hypothetical protein